MARPHKYYSIITPLIIVISAACALGFFLKQHTTSTQANHLNEKHPKKQPTKTFIPKPYPYKKRNPSRDGTGKIYMGREISKVMGHTGIRWLERQTREREENPTRAVQGLTLSPNAVVADIGSGSGYYTFRIAPSFQKVKLLVSISSLKW